MKKLSILSVVSALLAASCVGAEKSSNPLSPSVAGPIPGVNITPPKPLEPRDGIRIAVDLQPVTLLLENAATNGERPLSYVFDVATDTGFTNKVFTREGVTPGEGGRTALRLPDPLASGRTYYWRAQAKDGANTGPVSPLAFFTIFTPIVIEKPRLDSPINNTRLDDLQPEFRITNAPRSGPVGAINYVLELSDTDSFANKVAVWTFREQPGQTRFDAPHALVGDKQFFWRVQAFDTNTNASGPWSDVQIFRTPVPVVAAARRRRRRGAGDVLRSTLSQPAVRDRPVPSQPIWPHVTRRDRVLPARRREGPQRGGDCRRAIRNLAEGVRLELRRVFLRYHLRRERNFSEAV